MNFSVILCALAIIVSPDGTNRVMTSTNGITWTPRAAAVANNWRSVTFGNNLFVAVSDTGSNDRLMYSTNGTTWTGVTSAVTNQPWISVTYGNGLFVAVGVSVPMTSTDGINWTSRSVPAQNWFSVTYGNGLFVAVSSTGTNRVMTSGTFLTAPAFTLSSSVQSVAANSAITTVNSISSGGAIASYAISPAAPAGLTFSNING